MASNQQFKIDPTESFYVAVGAGDLAVELARTAAVDVQSRFSKLDLEPTVLREQARTALGSGVNSLKDPREVQAKLAARVSDLQAEAMALPSRLEGYFNENVANLDVTYAALAVRGKVVVDRIRKQEAAKEAKAAAGTAVAKAKTTSTQTAKTAKTAKKSAGTAKKSAKATGTATKKSATATKKAATEAAKETAKDTAPNTGEKSDS